MTKPKIKVSGISSLTDARYCAGMEVDFLGIQFDSEGNSAVDRNHFVSISGWIEGPVWVGEFAGTDVEKLLSLASDFGLKTMQVESPGLVRNLTENGVSAGLKLSMATLRSTDWKQLNPAYILISDANPEFMTSKELESVSEKVPVFVEGVSAISQIEKIMNHNPLIGFNLYSGEEERPGWMDLSHLQDLLEALEELQN